MTIEKANEIAMNWRMQPGTQHFVLDVQKADELFREWWGGYLARDEEFFTKIGARAEFEEFAKTTPANQIDAPLVLVYPPQNDRPPALVFLDGRHRYCVLRDAGVKRIGVCGLAPSKDNARILGILIDETKENTHG